MSYKTHINDNSDEDLNRDIERLLDRYDSKSKDFDRYFALLLGVSLFILLFMLYPYVSNQILKQYKIQEEGMLDREIDYLNNITNLLNSSIRGMEILENNLLTLPMNLNIFINDTVSGQSLIKRDNNNDEDFFPPSMSQESTQSGIFSAGQNECDGFSPTSNNTSDKWVKCKIDEKVEEEIQSIRSILDNEVAKYLRQIPNETIKDRIKVNALENNLTTLKNNISKEIERNPDFYRTYEEKEELVTNLSKYIKKFWDGYEPSITIEINSAEDEIIKTKTQKNNTLEELSQIDKDQEEITNKLKEFNSPVGKLVIGFDSLISMFPIALAGGFSVCASLLLQTFKIRKDLAHLYIKKGKSDLNLKERIISIAPLWIDHENEKQNKLIRFSVLLVPLFLYAILCSLIYLSWLIPEPTESINVLPHHQIWFISIYTILGIVLFGYSYIRIIKESGYKWGK